MIQRKLGLPVPLWGVAGPVVSAAGAALAVLTRPFAATRQGVGGAHWWYW